MFFLQAQKTLTITAPRGIFASCLLELEKKQNNASTWVNSEDWLDSMHEANVVSPDKYQVAGKSQALFPWWYILSFLDMPMSQSRTNNFIHNPFFAGKGGEWKKKRKKSLPSAFFSPSRKETLLLWCGRGHAVTQQLDGNRTSTLAASFMRVLRGSLLPGPLFLLVTCALKNREQQLGSWAEKPPLFAMTQGRQNTTIRGWFWTGNNSCLVIVTLNSSWIA